MAGINTHAPKGERDPLRKLDATGFAPQLTRRSRSRVLHICLLSAAVVFVALAVTARMHGYSALDLNVTRAVQRYHGAAFANLMVLTSWIGFMPQVIVIGGAGAAGLFLMGLRWEAAALLFAGVANALGALVKVIVQRPRPTADLVQVFAELNSPGFPSGHVLSVTASGGFLVFLVYTLLKPTWWRTLMLTLLLAQISLMGLSRIYMGQHWFSDTLGAYLLGSLWLALTIRFYRWGKIHEHRG